MDQLVQDIADAIRAGNPIPKMPANLSLDDAYSIQRGAVALLAGPDALSGIKAGVTSAPAQQQFGIEAPLLASLFTKGENHSGCILATRPGVLIECELGIIINAAGEATAAVPVIEIPYMAFADAGDRTGINLAASNVASDRYILGEKREFLSSYEDFTVALTCDGKELSNASLTEAQGGPHLALDWMLDEAKKRGIKIADDMLLMTGACGGIHPGPPGSYRVDYGDLGVIEFELV